MSMNNKATVDAIDSASSLRRATMSDLLKPPTSGFKSFVSSRRASNLFKKEKRNIIENNDYNNINNSNTSVLSESPLLKQQIKRLIDNNSSNNHHNILNTQLSLQLSNDKNKHIIQSLLKVNNSPQHKKIIDLISPSKSTLPISSLSANKMLATTDTENYPEFHIIKNRIIDTIINHYNDVDDESALSSISKHQSQSINYMLSTATTKTFSPSKDSTLRLVSSITSSSLSPQRTVTTQEKDTTTTTTTDSTTSTSNYSSNNNNNNSIINSSNSKPLISTITSSPLSTTIPIETITDNITTSTNINKNIKNNLYNNNSNNKEDKQEENKQLQHQIIYLQSKLLEKEQSMNQKNEKRWQEIENRRLMACEEVNGVNFINSVLEQKIEELEQHLSRER